jgi:Leucine Rich repeat
MDKQTMKSYGQILNRIYENDTTLNKVYLGYQYKLTDKDAMDVAISLSTNTTAIELFFRTHKNIHTIGWYAMASAIRRNATLLVLDLWECTLCFDSASAIFDALIYNKTIRRVNLGDTKWLTSSSHHRILLGYQLDRALQSNTVLTDLDLSNNSSIDNSFTINAFGKGLKNNSTLTKLTLTACSIGAKGICAIAKSLIHNSTLRIIRLSCNRMGNEGAIAISKMLCKNSSITELDVRDNAIGDEGIESLATSLYWNTSLTILSLDDNRMTNKSGRALANSIRYHPKLCSLSIENNQLTEDGLLYFVKAIEYNESLVQINAMKPRLSDELIHMLTKNWQSLSSSCTPPLHDVNNRSSSSSSSITSNSSNFHKFVLYNDTIEKFYTLDMNHSIIDLLHHDDFWASNRRRPIPTRKGARRRDDQILWLLQHWSAMKQD